METEGQEKSTKGHSEFDLVLVLILIGLLGIAAFIYVLKDSFVPSFPGHSETHIVGNPDDVLGRDSEKLGLRIDTGLGKFFVHPETKQTLYVNKKNQCLGECLNLFEPLYEEEEYDNNQGLRTISRSDGKLQLSWRGRGLYTFKEDSGGSILGDKHSNEWEIARP